MKTTQAAVITMTAIILSVTNAMGDSQTPINLGSAGNFAILAKSGISTVTGTQVTGDLGVSPISATGITGFSLILDGTGAFSRSVQVTGKIYAADYADPTPVVLTTAVGDMGIAYDDAAGRSPIPTGTFLNRGAGTIGGLTLAPGLYKWTTSVLIDSDVTIAGAADDVWIFQIADNLTVAESTSVLLSGSAQAKNIFWQVAGGVGVAVGPYAHVEGIILAKAGITVETDASINGRLLAQTAVTLQSNAIVEPAASDGGTAALLSAAVIDGPYTDTAGQYLSLATRSISAPMNGIVQFYRIEADTETTITGITARNGTVVITYE